MPGGASRDPSRRFIVVGHLVELIKNGYTRLTLPNQSGYSAIFIYRKVWRMKYIYPLHKLPEEKQIPAGGKAR